MGEVVLISRPGDGCGGVGERKADQQERQGQVLELLLAALRKSVALPCQMADADDPAAGAGAWGMDIGWPTDVRHVAHVTFDRLQGFLGLPVEFELQIPCPAPSASASVFGVSPESMQCGYDDRGNSVPKILLLMQERLYSQDGLKAEGIFRITPENSQEEHVREQLNRGVVPDDIDVHCLASLIKAWFRELPEGVLDSLSPEQVLNCNTEEQCVELVSHIPVTHAALLSWVVELMADVVEEEESNKMNARNIAMVFAPNMTQMSDPLTALMHAVQVMNLLKTLVLKTLREREEDEGSYSTFSSSPTLSDGLDEVDREHDQGDGNDSGTEKYGDDSSESSKSVDKANNLITDSEQLIGSSRRHTSFEFRLPCTINNDDDDKYPSLNDIEEGFLRRLEWQEVSKGGDEKDEGSIFFTSTKDAEQLSSSETISESCRVSDQTSSTEDAVGTNSIEPTMQVATRTETTSEKATNAKEVS
ncbi:rho GTPase-activating protein 5-like [Triticum dicoccoides]|nr:rho GTPase-activating protein 5-like [Triticum dicoccoides]XP_044321747.1 rho GTPase-activating protein 5-like [Triticum aestivum]